VVESDSKEVQQFREILEDTLKSAPSKNAYGGIKPGKVIAKGKTAAASKGTKLGEDDATHQAIGKVIADGNKAITSEEVNPSPGVAPETDTTTHISKGNEPETDTAKHLVGGKD
jgi:hypothetical protein